MNRVFTIISTWFQSKVSTSEVPTSQPSQTEANLTIRPKKIISSMLVAVPAIHGKGDMSFVFPPSLLSQVEHSEAQLCYVYIGCFHTGLLAKDRHKPSRRFQVGLRFFLFHISCSNFWADRTFQASAQTLFDARFGLNFHIIPTFFSLLYPNIHTYIITRSSHFKWVSGYILFTLHSSDHSAFCSL